VNTLLVALGRRIKALRLEKGLSQENFAFDCNLHRTYLSHVELGRKNISFNNLVTLSAAFGLTLSEFFAGLEAGEPIKAQPGGQTERADTARLPFGKLPPDVNRLVTELRVQRVTMDRALTALNELMVGSGKRKARPRPKKPR
jgi:transcriptional regulator with XRE-family HTH domain